MSRLFSQVFCCCLRARSPSPDAIPDERTRLLPGTEEIPHPAPRTVTPLDHQRIKERLGSIVRAKEGKMVNIASHIPFNLHNRPPSAHLDPAASSSRSRARVSRFASPTASPAPSTASLPLTQSALESSVASLAPPSGSGEEQVAPAPRPTLAVELVVPPARDDLGERQDGSADMDADAQSAQRGRSRTRRSTGDGSALSGVHVVVDGPSDGEGEDDAGPGSDRDRNRVGGHDSEPTPGLTPIGPKMAPPRRASDLDVDSVGAVSRSWGD